VLLAEDGGGGNHLVAATADGTTFPIASESGGEFAGSVFSRDGRTLFANLQSPGAQFAISGSWR
jgi:secreted PhoX family phosphatase